MTEIGVVALYLIELRVHEKDKAIVPTIHSALLQCAEQLGEPHRNRRSAERLKGLDVNNRGHSTKLQTLHVRRLGNCDLAVCNARVSL